MASLTAVPESSRLRGTEDVAPKARAAERPFYKNLFAIRWIGDQRSNVKRLADDATILAQCTVADISSRRGVKDLGCEIEIESRRYAARRPLRTVIPLDDYLLTDGERSHGGGSVVSWARVPDDDLSPGYLDMDRQVQDPCLGQTASGRGYLLTSLQMVRAQTRSRPSRASRFGRGQ